MQSPYDIYFLSEQEMLQNKIFNSREDKRFGLQHFKKIIKSYTQQ